MTVKPQYVYRLLQKKWKWHEKLVFSTKCTPFQLRCATHHTALEIELKPILSFTTEGLDNRLSLSYGTEIGGELKKFHNSKFKIQFKHKLNNLEISWFPVKTRQNQLKQGMHKNDTTWLKGKFKTSFGTAICR